MPFLEQITGILSAAADSFARGLYFIVHDPSGIMPRSSA